MYELAIWYFTRGMAIVFSVIYGATMMIIIMALSGYVILPSAPKEPVTTISTAQMVWTIAFYTFPYWSWLLWSLSGPRPVKKEQPADA